MLSFRARKLLKFDYLTRIIQCIVWPSYNVYFGIEDSLTSSDSHSYFFLETLHSKYLKKYLL